mmetsp:Transcript_58497/g.187932  ORF Transcript_58497/g.187932 Transcript_58497/m.187932 type:complete len:126 (-) Transcript_58497:81-458(-)
MLRVSRSLRAQGRYPTTIHRCKAKLASKALPGSEEMSAVYGTTESTPRPAERDATSQKGFPSSRGASEEFDGSVAAKAWFERHPGSRFAEGPRFGDPSLSGNGPEIERRWDKLGSSSSVLLPELR